MLSMESVVNKIEQALEQIRPYLHQDGGDVEIHSIDEDYNLVLRYLGACETCKMNTFTLRTGIEETIKEHVPEVKTIEAINAIEL